MSKKKVDGKIKEKPSSGRTHVDTRSSVCRWPVSTADRCRSPRTPRSSDPWCCVYTGTGRKPCRACGPLDPAASIATRVRNTNNFLAPPSRWSRSNIFPAIFFFFTHDFAQTVNVRKRQPQSICLTSISLRLSNKSSPSVWSLVKLIRKLVIFSKFCTSDEYGSSYIWCKLGGKTLKITYNVINK